VITRINQAEPDIVKPTVKMRLSPHRGHNVRCAGFAGLPGTLCKYDAHRHKILALQAREPIDGIFQLAHMAAFQAQRAPCDTPLARSDITNPIHSVLPYICLTLLVWPSRVSPNLILSTSPPPRQNAKGTITALALPLVAGSTRPGHPPYRSLHFQPHPHDTYFY
jgi:hypothetical protein